MVVCGLLMSLVGVCLVVVACVSLFSKDCLYKFVWCKFI